MAKKYKKEKECKDKSKDKIRIFIRLEVVQILRIRKNIVKNNNRANTLEEFRKNRLTRIKKETIQTIILPSAKRK